MVSVAFKQRLVFDIHFYEDIKKGVFKESKPTLFNKLMRINDKSKKNSRVHNLMSKKMFDNILTNNPNMPRAILRMAFYPHDDVELEKIDDEIERTIKLAIDMLDEEPHSTIIMTSEEKHPRMSSESI
jgi:hypothetical protein